MALLPLNLPLFLSSSDDGCHQKASSRPPRSLFLPTHPVAGATGWQASPYHPHTSSHRRINHPIPSIRYHAWLLPLTTRCHDIATLLRLTSGPSLITGHRFLSMDVDSSVPHPPASPALPSTATPSQPYSAFAVA